MAGTLTISTLSDGTNSTSSTNCIQGSAKAWVNFNGSGTPAIRASYNVASITKIGTGQYTVNLSNAMVDANYSCSFTPGVDSGSTGAGCFTLTVGNTRSTTQIGMRCARADTGATADATDANIVIFR